MGKEPQEKLKAGAKLKCTPQMIKRTYELSSKLFLDCQIMEALGISKQTFYRWKKEDKEFCDALTKGKAITLEVITNNLIEKAKSDTVAMMFVLKNKYQWWEHNQKKTLKVKEKELALKEKTFKLQTEKFISELCDKNELNKEETLALLKQHLSE